MLLNDFSGGLNTRVSPHLIQPNQGQVYTNVDNASGSLKSVKGPVATGVGVTGYFTYYWAATQWVSRATKSDFIEYKDLLYISNGTDDIEVFDGATSGTLGIIGPTNILDVEELPIGTVTITDITDTTGLSQTVNYKYKLVINSTLASSNLYRDYSYTIPYNSGIIRAVQFTLSNLDASIVTLGDAVTLYREYEGEYRLVYSGVYANGMTITDNDINIGANAKLETSLLENTVSYVYTYFNSTSGIESKPSLPSNDVNMTAKVTGITLSADPAVDAIRLYRIGGGLTSYTLVDTLSNATQAYIDYNATLDIAGNWVLDSINNDLPIAGLQYITEAYAMLFASKGTRLYYSEIAKPYAWPAFNYIDFDTEITGIGAVSNGLLVFTKYKTYIVTGNSPASFSKYLLNGEQGCVAHSTIQFADNTLVWVSTDGICASSGGKVELLSMPLIGKLTYLEIYNAAILDNVYYLSLRTATGHRLLALDFRYNKIIRYIDNGNSGTYIVSTRDNLYQFYNSNIQRLLDGSDLTIDYKSPILTEGKYSNYKTYKDFYIKYNGTFTLKIYIDNTLVLTKALSGDAVYNAKSLGLSKGYGLEFVITGTGEISEIDYEVVGRQNGK